MATQYIANKKYIVETRNANTWEWNQPGHSCHNDIEAAKQCKAMIERNYADEGVHGDCWVRICEVMAVSQVSITYKPVQ